MDHKLLYPYQQQILKDIVSGVVFKSGELMHVSTGRQLGKSRVNQYLQQWMQWLPDDATKYKVHRQALVDNKPWYTVHCGKDVSAWIRQQPCKDKEWYQHIDARWDMYAFDITEELYMLLVLKFGK